MVNAPVSLIRTPDPHALLVAADALLPATGWALTRALLPTFGLATRAVELGAAILATNDDDTDLTLRYMLCDASATLDVGLAPSLVDRICAHRLGGSPARRKRHGRVEISIARSLADAVAADLSGARGIWRASARSNDVGPSVERMLTLDDGADGSPQIRLRLGGIRRLDECTGDAAWPDRLAALIGDIRLPVRGVLARPLLSAGEIARLVVGDVIPIRTPDRVTLLAGSHRLATGLLVERDGHAAIDLDPELEPLS